MTEVWPVSNGAAAFFDLDRTLISGSSAFAFAAAARRHDLMSRRQLLKDAGEGKRPQGVFLPRDEVAQLSDEDGAALFRHPQEGRGESHIVSNQFFDNGHDILDASLAAHSPLNYAAEPTSLARRWFSDPEIELNLDALVRAQGDDGGWFVNWREWNPASTLHSRGLVTLRALRTLRSYGRLAT